MSAWDNSPQSPLTHLLVIGGDGLPCVVEVIDGDSTGLAKIVSAIIQAGFAGVRAAPMSMNMFDVQFNLATPEGAYIAYLRNRAIQGLTLPPVEKVLEILRPARRPRGGSKKWTQ